MTAGKLPHPILITRREQLLQLADRLQEGPIVAVDTESNSLFAYREQVCLIQFSARGEDYLVDPLALNDLSPLAGLFSDPAVEKVFHAAEYDVICMRRDFGFEFNNLFDTMIAARILGRDGVGLGSLLQAEFSVHLNKRFQRANWGQRPLPPHLLDYARLDTHYLIALRDRLKKQLQQTDLWPLAMEDFERLRQVNGNLHDGVEKQVHAINPWRVKGAYDLTPGQAAVLFELCRYRDQVASSINRPLFKVINDHTLLSISIMVPQNLKELSSIDGMSPRQVRRHGKKILPAIQRGLQADPLYPPKPPRPSEKFVRRLERLRRWRKVTAQGLGVQSDVILPRDLLYSLAASNPASEAELAQDMKDVPWRMERFGNQILDVLSGIV